MIQNRAKLFIILLSGSGVYLPLSTKYPEIWIIGAIIFSFIIFSFVMLVIIQAFNEHYNYSNIPSFR